MHCENLYRTANRSSKATNSCSNSQNYPWRTGVRGRAAIKIETKIPEETSLSPSSYCHGDWRRRKLRGWRGGSCDWPSTDDPSAWGWHVSSILAHRGDREFSRHPNCWDAWRGGVQSTLRSLCGIRISADSRRGALEGLGPGAVTHSAHEDAPDPYCFPAPNEAGGACPHTSLTPGPQGCDQVRQHFAPAPKYVRNCPQTRRRSRGR